MRFLKQLARDLDHYSPSEALRLSSLALEVLAIRLAHELDESSWVVLETHKAALVTRIHAFIHEHLGDPALSPGAVAAAHHISLRYPHKLFQEQGETWPAGSASAAWRPAAAIWPTRRWRPGRWRRSRRAGVS